MRPRSILLAALLTLASFGTAAAQPCPAGRFSPTGSEPCQNCAAGTYSSTAGSTSCQSCAPGFFSAPGSVLCAPCAQGTFTPVSGSATCSTCPDGYIAPSLGSALCTPCADGTTSNQDHTQCVAAAAPGPSGWANVLLGTLFLATALTVLGRERQA